MLLLGRRLNFCGISGHSQSCLLKGESTWPLALICNNVCRFLRLNLFFDCRLTLLLKQM